MPKNCEFNVQMKGQYRWEQIFDIDNSTNKGTIKREVVVETEVTISYENMVRSLDSHAIAASLGFHAGGLFEILDIGVKGDLNTEVKSEYEKIGTTKTEYRKKTVKTDTYEVGPESTLKLYRLVFEGPGATYLTDTISTSTEARPDVLIDVKGKLLPVLKDIEVVYTKDSVSRPDYLIQESHGYSADINSGYGGEFVWLKPIWADDASEGATGLEVVVQTEKNDNYKDLAKGADGKYRYLKMLRDPHSKQRITDIALWRRYKDSGTALYPPADKYRFRTEDINVGRGGDDLFLVWNGGQLQQK